MFSLGVAACGVLECRQLRLDARKPGRELLRKLFGSAAVVVGLRESRRDAGPAVFEEAGERLTEKKPEEADEEAEVEELPHDHRNTEKGAGGFVAFFGEEKHRRESHAILRPSASEAISRAVERAFFDTYPATDTANFHGAWAVYPFLPSGNILISNIDGAGGLFILKEAPEAVVPSIPPRAPVSRVPPRPRIAIRPR